MGLDFSSPRHGIVVTQNMDGSYSWTGSYGGTPIIGAIPSEKGQNCVVLLDPGAGDRLVFENLLCIDCDGTIIWAAKLPSMPDCFVGMDRKPNGILANTFSGFLILMDSETGAELESKYVK